MENAGTSTTINQNMLLWPFEVHVSRCIYYDFGTASSGWIKRPL